MATTKFESKKWGCILHCIEQRKDDWMSVRKQPSLVIFSRNSDAIEDSAIRQFLDMTKQLNASKAFVCASAGFTSSATGYAENRPIELIAKDKLEQILAKAGI